MSQTIFLHLQMEFDTHRLICICWGNIIQSHSARHPALLRLQEMMSLTCFARDQAHGKHATLQVTILSHPLRLFFQEALLIASFKKEFKTIETPPRDDNLLKCRDHA